MLGLWKLDVRPAIEQPAFWLIAFHESAHAWWVRHIPGRHKHVSVIGFFPEAKAWVMIDPALWGTRLLIYADTDAGLNELARWVDDATVVRMPAGGQDLDALRARRARGLGLGRLGSWCVPAVRHLTGVRSRALLPDTLLRDCLREGGVIAARPGDDHDENAESAAGPRT